VKKLYSESDAAQQSLMSAMQEYQDQAGAKYRVDVDLADHHDWDEMMNYVQNVQEQYSKDKLKGSGGRVRSFARKFCEQARSLKAFVALMPSESLYGSVVCGSLKLIFGVSRKSRNL
jgi:hypothetical protein